MLYLGLCYLMILLINVSCGYMYLASTYNCFFSIAVVSCHAASVFFPLNSILFNSTLLYSLYRNLFSLFPSIFSISIFAMGVLLFPLQR